jgi:hypothetical protein
MVECLISKTLCWIPSTEKKDKEKNYTFLYGLFLPLSLYVCVFIHIWMYTVFITYIYIYIFIKEVSLRPTEEEISTESKKACLAQKASQWILMVKTKLKYHSITNNLELEITMLKGFIL